MLGEKELGLTSGDCELEYSRFETDVMGRGSLGLSGNVRGATSVRLGLLDDNVCFQGAWSTSPAMAWLGSVL